MCTAPTVTPEVAAKIASMTGSRRALQLIDATSESLATVRLVPTLLELQVTALGPIDLAPIADLHELKTLTIEHARVDSLAPLSSLIVEKLVLDGVVGFDSLAPVAAMPAILDLSVRSSTLSSISALGGMHLRSLSVKSTELKSLDGIDRIGGLEQVAFETCPILDLTPLGNLQGVTNVAVGWTNLPPTVVLPPHATTVALVADQMRNISFLKGKTEITSLSLLSNYLEDLGPLASLTNLKSLNLDRNATLKNLAPLRKLSNLETLGISDTAVDSLDDLAGLPLKDIYLGHTHARSLAPLVKIKTLTGIDFLPNNYPPAELDAVRKTHPLLRVSRL
jgi:internalin A